MRFIKPDRGKILYIHEANTPWALWRQMETKATDITYHEIKAISWIWHLKWHPIYDKYDYIKICIGFGIDKQPTEHMTKNKRYNVKTTSFRRDYVRMTLFWCNNDAIIP